jgi:predicted  nucleic acid-binding Zn-ribbon protein
MSDGETAEEALANAQQAILEWIDTARRRDLPLPVPGSSVRRARREKERLVADLKDLAGNLDQIECRVDELERVLRNMEERLDHEEEWARFAEITVLPVRSAKPLKGSA